jgi:hypothetical protein
MTRASCLLGILAITAGAVPGCSGNQFTAADESEAGDAGEAGAGAMGGSGGTSGKGGSSSGTAGSDVGGNGTGGAGRGGTSGTSSGGSQTGGDAGDGASGGSGPGGMGGSSGASMGGAGAGSGGASTTGGFGGAGSGGKGGSGGAGSGGKGGSGGAGSGGKGGSGGAGPSMCPPSAPSPNSACSFMGHCSYGTHPLERCRDVYACDGVRWQQTQDATCTTPPSCQELPTPPVINAQCMPEGAECQGNNLYCLCAPNCSTVCSVPPIWHCFGTPGDCPAVLPNRGQPCNVNLSCVYGSCASQTGVQAICENGFWVWYGLICPQ